MISLKLEECLGPDIVASLSDPQGTTLKYEIEKLQSIINVVSPSAELCYNNYIDYRQLVSQIELFKQTSVSPSTLSESQKTDESVEAGILKYQMMYLPEKARMQEAARIAQLEQRLCCLENIIGTSNDKLSKFSQVEFIIFHLYMHFKLISV